MRFREEVINVEFAKMLREHGLKANPETIKKEGLPDVMISLEGIKVNLEGRFQESSQISNLKKDCKGRIEDGIADISIGIIYPNDLREAENIEELKEKIKKSVYNGFVLYYSSNGLSEVPFRDIDIRELIENIHGAFNLIVNNDIVRGLVKEVGGTINKATEIGMQSNIFFRSKKLMKELKEALGIKEEGYEEKEED